MGNNSIEIQKIGTTDLEADVKIAGISMVFHAEGRNHHLTVMVFVSILKKRRPENQIRKQKQIPRFLCEIRGFCLELMTGFEPVTSSLPRMRSTY